VQVVAADGVIFMVLEYGDIDLARLLAKQEAARRDQAAAGAQPDENFIRLYWQQMLQARGCMTRCARGAEHGTQGGSRVAGVAVFCQDAGVPI
jgi:hypothetical protein